MATIPEQVFKNTIALAVARISNMASGFVLAYLMARTLGVMGLGIYSTVISFHSLAGILCAVGMRSFLTRDIARDLSQTNRYMIHAGLITTVVSIAGNVVFFLLTSQLSYAPETLKGVIIANLGLFPYTWGVIYESVFIAHRKAEYLSYTTIISLVGRIGVSIYLLFNGYGVISILVTMVIFGYISFVLQTWYLVRYVVVPHWEFELSFALQMIKELRTFTVIGFLGSMFAQIEILLLSSLQDEAAVGIYSAASKVTLAWYVIPDSYMRAIFPLLSHTQVHSPQVFQRLIERSVKYLLALALPLAVGTFVIADKIVYLFYGPDFEASAIVSRWLALLFIPIFLNEVLWRILIARNEQHLTLRAQIAGVVAKGGVSLLAVPSMSYMGTVLAMVSTHAVYTSMHIFYVQRGGKPIPFIRLIWRFALAASLMGGFTWLLALRYDLFIVVPLAIAFYSVLVFLLRAFSSDDLALFNRLVRKREASPTLPSQPQA